MIFSAIFAIAILDALANGPKLSGARLYAIAAASLIALGSQQTVAFVLAELILIALFAESAVLERQAKQEAEEKAKAEKAQGRAEAENGLPANARAYLEAARDLFNKNADGPVNAFGQPWKVLLADGGVTISQSDFPNQSCKWWKVEGEITGDIKTIMKEIMDYEARCKWDSSLQSGKIVKEFEKLDIGTPYLAVFYTAPAAAGMVTSRELVELGLLIEENGGFDYVNCSLPKSIKFKEAPSKITGERAFSHQGSGIRVTPIPGSNKFKYLLVNAMDLGGWLPASIVNSATSGALGDGTKAMIAHLAKA